MIYHGFAVRDYLIIHNLPLDNNNLSVMEIGIGTGSTMEIIAPQVKEYFGIDKSYDTISVLKNIYKNIDHLSLFCIDVCDNTSLNKLFDLIFSADTLEHVVKPGKYFDFISQHLSTNGISVITFPNESENQHHGITWFNHKSDLLNLIESAGLEAISIYEVTPTLWHQIIRKIFWELPKYTFSPSKENYQPQVFDQTIAFNLISKNNFKSKMLTLYANIITRIASIFELYEYKIIDENIHNKILILKLKKQSNI